MSKTVILQIDIDSLNRSTLSMFGQDVLDAANGIRDNLKSIYGSKIILIAPENSKINNIGCSWEE